MRQQQRQNTRSVWAKLCSNNRIDFTLSALLRSILNVFHVSEAAEILGDRETGIVDLLQRTNLGNCAESILCGCTYDASIHSSKSSQNDQHQKRQRRASLGSKSADLVRCGSLEGPRSKLCWTICTSMSYLDGSAAKTRCVELNAPTV